MMIREYAIIQNGEVVNVIVADEKEAALRDAILLPDGIAIGDFFDGENWTKAEQEDLLPNYITFLQGFFDGYVSSTVSEGEEYELGVKLGKDIANIANDHR